MTAPLFTPAPTSVPAPPTPEHVPACRVSDIPDGEGLRVLLPAPVALFRVDGSVYALDDTCTHQDASLADGWVENCAVECPLHASCFDLRTGAVSGPPAKVGVRTHEVLVVDDVVWVRRP